MTDTGHTRRTIVSPRRWPWGWIYVWAVVAFLFTPVLLVALFSFHSSASLSLPFQGFSTRWYTEVFEAPDIRQAAENSVVVAAVTTAATTTLGTLAALGLVRLSTRVRNRVTNVAITPILLPGIFLGISLLVTFSLIEVRLSLTTVVIAHIVFTTPLFVLIARARLDRFDLALEEAARDLGASAFQTARLVTFPIIRPALFGAAFLVFALSFDEFIIALFVVGADPTLPVVIWGQMRRAADPSINAISTLLLAVSFTGLLIASSLIRDGGTTQVRAWRRSNTGRTNA